MDLEAVSNDIGYRHVGMPCGGRSQVVVDCSQVNKSGRSDLAGIFALMFGVVFCLPLKRYLSGPASIDGEAAN